MAPGAGRPGDRMEERKCQWPMRWEVKGKVEARHAGTWRGDYPRQRRTERVSGYEVKDHPMAPVGETEGRAFQRDLEGRVNQNR